jgi:hypothetical protein
MCAVRLVKKHRNETVNLCRKSDDMLFVYGDRLILLGPSFIIKFRFVVLAIRRVKLFNLLLKRAEGFKRLDLNLCLPIGSFGDRVRDFGVPCHDDFHREKCAAEKVAITVQNMAGLATIYNLKVHELEIRTDFVNRLGDNGDPVVKEDEFVTLIGLVECRLNFHIHRIITLEVANVVVKQAPLQIALRVTN